MNLTTAIRRNATLKDTLGNLQASTVARAGIEGAWQAVMGLQDNGTAMACAVRLTIPVDYIPLLRSVDAVPACYFLVCLCEVLTKAQMSDADFGDTLPCSDVVKDAFLLLDERRKAADTLAEGLGCDKSPAWNLMRKCDDKSAALTARMVEIARLAGRMFDAMSYYGIPNETKDPQRVQGVENGDEVARLLDDEVALLNVPGANADMLARLEERQAAQYEMTGESPKGRGPLVVAIDESGSMHGGRQVWSKAAAIALARVACSENRKVRVVRFSTATRVLDLDTSDLNTMRELAFGHLGGGTSIDTALNESMVQVGNLEAEGYRGADIVFITDGEDHVNTRLLDKMKNQGIRLWTISIECDLANGQYSKALATYAAKYMHVQDNTLTTDGVNAMAGLKDAALDNNEDGYEN